MQCGILGAAQYTWGAVWCGIVGVRRGILGTAVNGVRRYNGGAGQYIGHGGILGCGSTYWGCSTVYWGFGGILGVQWEEQDSPRLPDCCWVAGQLPPSLLAAAG
ncbi:hypothetical protein FKM82_022162 [Ascaphus truei]